MSNRKKTFFFLLLLLFSLFFFSKKEEGYFYRFSMEQMENLCSFPELREMFGIDENEAKEVFGDLGEDIFL